MHETSRKKENEKKDRILRFVVIFVLCCCVLLPPLYLGGVFSPTMNYRQSEKYLQKNRHSLDVVVNYLCSLPSEHAFCSKSGGYASVYQDQKWSSVEDPDVVQALKHLFEETSCYEVSKNSDTIAFVLWAKNMDVGGGIAYSPTERLEVEYLSASQVLSDASWYYYVSDFNEWRLQQ